MRRLANGCRSSNVLLMLGDLEQFRVLLRGRRNEVGALALMTLSPGPTVAPTPTIDGGSCHNLGPSASP